MAEERGTEIPAWVSLVAVELVQTEWAVHHTPSQVQPRSPVIVDRSLGQDGIVDFQASGKVR